MEFGVPGLGIRGLGFCGTGFVKVMGFGYEVSRFGLSGFTVRDVVGFAFLDFRFRVSRFRVRGSRFRGLGSRVRGLGFGVSV